MAREGKTSPRPAGRLSDPIPLRRLKDKQDVLEGWLRYGVPPDKVHTVPRSLRQAIVWEDADLGLRAGGSRRDFVTTNPVFGKTVEKIQVAIVALKKALSQPRVVPLFDQAVGANTVAAKHPPELVAAVSQWHAERHKAQHLEEELLNVQHQRSLAEDDVARLEDEIRGLRFRLSASAPLRLVHGTQDGSVKFEAGTATDPKLPKLEDDPTDRRGNDRG